MKNTKEYIKVKDEFLSKEVFSLAIDEAAEMLLTLPKPKQDRLAFYYDTPNYISHTNKAKGLFSKIYFFSRKVMLSVKLRMISRLFLKPGLALDVGSGTGVFLNALKKSGWKVKGLEPNKIAKERAQKMGIDHLISLKKLDGIQQDLITFWHSLEHVYSLKETIDEVEKTLKPGGVLIVACPNYTSLDAKYYKKNWAAWDVPRHLRHFSPTSLELLLGPKGFTQIKKRPLFLDAFYVSILSEKSMGHRFSFVRGLAVGLISNLVGCLTNNYSSQVYVLKKHV